MAVPGPELRRFADPSRPQGQGDGLGLEAHGDREAWIAARREWEARHGVRIDDWYAGLCDDALARSCPDLAGFYAMTGPYFTEGEDAADPREAAA